MQLAVQIGVTAALLALAIGCAVVLRDATHPAALMPGLWALVSAAYLLPHGMRPVGLGTWLLVLSSCAAFVLGSMATRRTAPVGASECVESTVWRPVLFWVALLGLPLFAYRAIEIAESAAFTESMLINLRIALTGELDDVQTYGVLAYLVPVAFTSTLVELATSPPGRGFTARGGVALAASLAYSVMATGRTYLFLLAIALAFVALSQRRIRPATLAWVGALVVGVLFFGLGWLFNKIGEDSPNSNALGAIDALGLYLLGGLSGFDLWLGAHGPLDWGLNTFRSVLAVAAALGLQVPVVPLVKEYVYLPEATNVYTVFRPYVEDFGRAGAAFFLACFGWLHARLYQAARGHDPRWVILHAISMYPLLMQFFQDQYFSLLSTWVEFGVLVALCFRKSMTPEPSRS